MKKLTTLALTGAMVAAMSCTAFAETITFTADCNTDASIGKVLIDATGATQVNISIDFGESYGGGGCGWNSVSNDGGWVNGIQYSNEDAEHTYTIDVADIAANEDGSQTFEIQCWWLGDPYTVEYTLVGADAAGEEVPVTEEPAETEAGEEAGEEAAGEDAGAAEGSGDVAPIAFLAAMVAVAGVAMVASKKRA